MERFAETLEARLFRSGNHLVHAGDIDASFGNGGRSALTLLISRAIAVQSDGKVVVAGSVDLTADNAALAVARYNADGTPDTTFGVGGRATTDASPSVDEATALAVLDDGRIVIAGHSARGDSIVLAAYLPNGGPDSSFGTAGLVLDGTGVANHSIVGSPSLLIQPDGKLLVAGSIAMNLSPGPTGDVFLHRYNTDGTLDATFGNNGHAESIADPDAEESVGAGLQPDGRITLGVRVTDNRGAAARTVLRRYRADGTRDQSFRGASIRSGTVADLAVLADGTTVVAGEGGGQRSGSDFALLRFDRNGSVSRRQSTNFGFQAPGFPPGGSDDTARALAVMGDGKVIVVGDASTGNEPVAIARYTPRGALDRRFGAGGKVLDSFGATGETSAIDVAAAPDDQFVVLAEVGGAYQLARYHGRTVPAVARVIGDTLRVRGTAGADQIVVARVASGSPVPGEAYDVSLNGFLQRVAPTTARSIVSIIIEGKGGDDVLTADAGSIPQTRILGGPGNDTIFCRNGDADLVIGGPGTDQAQVDERDGERTVEILLP